MHESRLSQKSPDLQTDAAKIKPNLSGQSTTSRSVFWPLFFKATALAMGIAALLLFLTGTVVAALLYRTGNNMLAQAGFQTKDVMAEVKKGWQTPLNQPDGVLTLLVLGSDELVTRPGSAPLTDSVMLVAIQLNSGTTSILSLPRDLWSQDYQTKINALYVYGQERYPTQPDRFPTEVISQMTTVPLDHTLVLNMSTVAQVIDAVGGIDVTVAESFTDTQFPRPDVDVTKVHDPELLYKTVEFTAGSERMNGERALEYIRSRHATGEIGTDTARSARQQAVIVSLMAALQQKSVLMNPQVVVRLLRIYHERFEPTLPIAELVALAKQLYPYRNQIKLQAASLSIAPDDPAGVITHPPDSKSAAYNGQWVYVITNQDRFVSQVRSKLELTPLETISTP